DKIVRNDFDSIMISDILFSPNGKYLAIQKYSDIELWDYTNWEKVKTFNWESKYPMNLAFSSKDKYLAVSNVDETIRLWDYEAANVVKDIYDFKNCGYIRDIEFSPDGKYLVVNDYDESIELLDTKTWNKVPNEFNTHKRSIEALSFCPDGKILASGSFDNTIKLWDMKTKTEIATLVALDTNDWVVVTPDGRFDATTNGMKLMHYVQDNKPIALEAFYHNFYTPVLLEQILTGEIKPEKDRGEILFPPAIELKSPMPNEIIERDLVQVKVELEDEGGGIDEIRLYQNGKLISEKKYGFQPGEFGKMEKKFNVSLLPGANTFKVLAYGTDRTESVEEFMLELSEEASQRISASSDLYILTVGINEYENTNYNINYGKPDALAFANSINKKSTNIFKNVFLYEIYDNKAVKNNIDSIFRLIASNAKQNDAFIFYYAGHGILLDNETGNPTDYYLALHDITRIYGNDNVVRKKGISAEELKDYCMNIKAQKQLFVLDACHSGGAVDDFAFRGSVEEKAIKQLSRSAGIVILASAGSEQVSTEFNQLGHGVFTYALLKGLDGEADNGDGKITVRELDAYLNDKVPELTEKYRGKKQYPNSRAEGNDFPVAIVR
ncbi:caspase family protein, partial [Bacteroidota bacterium]